MPEQQQPPSPAPAAAGPPVKTATSDMGLALTNRLFISVKQIGQCDERGRAVFAAGYSGKMIAQPERPIRTLILPLMQRMLEMSRYTDRAEFDADLAALRKFVDGLFIEKGGKPA